MDRVFLFAGSNVIDFLPVADKSRDFEEAVERLAYSVDGGTIPVYFKRGSKTWEVCTITYHQDSSDRWSLCSLERMGSTDIFTNGSVENCGLLGVDDGLITMAHLAHEVFTDVVLLGLD